MNRAQVIADTLVRLEQQDYRQGFEDSVLSQCRDALNEFDGSGSEFWNLMLSGMHGKEQACEQFLDNDEDLVDYYNQIVEMSEGPGCFVMPEWGTRGT